MLPSLLYLISEQGPSNVKCRFLFVKILGFKDFRILQNKLRSLKVTKSKDEKGVKGRLKKHKAYRLTW